MNDNKKGLTATEPKDIDLLDPKALVRIMSNLKMSDKEMREFSARLFERLLRPNAGLK